MWKQTRAVRWVLVLLLGTSATPGAEPGSAPATGASVVLVLDASSSMLGAIGKNTKMKVARDVTHDLLGSWDERLNVGLTAYGHRQAKSCGDIEAVVPLGPLNREAFNTAVDGLKPKGRTPLAAAIRNAADQLGYAQRKATIIVITDGIENCGGDPCAVAAELKAKGIDFTAHVVGLGALSAKDSKQLACIAEKTGGEYRGAKDAPALKAALGGLVGQVEEQGGLRPPTVGAGGASLRELPEQTSGNVKIRAVRTPGGVPLQTVWRIWNADKSKVVEQSDATKQHTFHLPPGSYRLVASAGGNVKTELPLEVAAGKNHALELAFNSGRVKFSTFEFDGGPSIQSIFRINPDGWKGGSAEEDLRSAPDFELMAGKYQLHVQVGNAKITRAFEVTPGSDTSQSIAMDVGKVTLRAVTTPGGTPISKNHWRLSSVPADGAKGAFVAGEDYRSAPKFILAAGDYLAKVEIDGGKKVEHRFAVKAGGNTSEEILVP
jgi:Ca-activated chloride channel family protein